MEFASAITGFIEVCSWVQSRGQERAPIQIQLYDLIRKLPILETNSAHFLKVLELGGVSTNVYLRRIHNFALDMNWLPWSVLPKRQWPKVKFKEKRAITLEEHERIIAAEVNPERKTLYQLCWHLGAIHWLPFGHLRKCCCQNS